MPFEISLDASLWADIVVVTTTTSLILLFGCNEFQPRGDHLLIDEAHQLFPRVNSMFAN